MTIPAVSPRLTDGAKTLVFAAAIFLALWFDPRITYLQRDISLAVEQINQVNTQGSRKDQFDIRGLQDQQNADHREIEKFDLKLDDMGKTLTAILNKLSERK